MEALHENLKVKFFARYCVSAPPLWQAQWMECLASQGPIIVIGDFFEDWLYGMSFLHLEFCSTSGKRRSGINQRLFSARRKVHHRARYRKMHTSRFLLIERKDVREQSMVASVAKNHS